jgi:hypothetical protein
MDRLASLQMVRGPDGRFLKGCSGNRRGRPPRSYKVKEIAQANVEDCVLKLAELAQDSNCPPNVNAFAVAILLGIAGNQNLMRCFLKKTKQQVREYLFLPPLPRAKLKPDEISPQLQKLLAVRKQYVQPIADKLARLQKKNIPIAPDDLSFYRALCDSAGIATATDDELAYAKAWG